MKNLKEMKSYLKDLVVEIRAMKDKRKGAWCGYVNGLSEKRFTYRHYHIAYCVLRGTPRELIENPRSDNHPDDRYIDQIVDSMEMKMEELDAE